MVYCIPPVRASADSQKLYTVHIYWDGLLATPLALPRILCFSVCLNLCVLAVNLMELESLVKAQMQKLDQLGNKIDGSSSD